MHAFTDPAEVERVVRLFDAERRAELVRALGTLTAKHDRYLSGRMQGKSASVVRDYYAEAHALLLDYIGDPEITAAFDAIAKWYA